MKEKIFNIIQIGDKSNRLSRAFDIFITIREWASPEPRSVSSFLLTVLWICSRSFLLFPVRVCHFPYVARGKSFPPVPSECQIWLFQRNHNCFIWKRNQIISSVFIVLILMLASSLCMYSVEHDAQPEVFRNAFSGIWWSMSTLLTIGYGDIYPITTLAICASAKRHDFEIEWYYYYTWENG